MRSIVLAALALLAATPSALAATELSDSPVDGLALTARRVAWIDAGATGTHVFEHRDGQTHTLATVGPGSIYEAVGSSTLFAWTRVDVSDPMFGDVREFAREVLVAGRRHPQVLQRCSTRHPCGCDPTTLDDAGWSLTVDGDHLSMSDPGCDRGVRIYARRETRMRQVAFLPDAQAGAELAGRYLAWGSNRLGAAGHVTLYDWRRQRVVRRFRFTRRVGDLVLDLQPSGRLVATLEPFDRPFHPRTFLLWPDGRRRALPHMGYGRWVGREQIQRVEPRLELFRHMPRRAPSRIVYAVRRGRSQARPVIDTGPLDWAIADGRCLLWQARHDKALRIGSIDGRPTSAPACSPG